VKVEIVKAEEKHLSFIADNIREADRSEIYDLTLMKPLEALKKSLDVSLVACTGLIDDTPICVFGVGDTGLMFNTGRPWMIGTNEIDKAPVTFLRRNKRYVQKMLDCYGFLENYVSKENERAIQWLKWLGFTFDAEPVNLGLFNKPFYRFWMVN